jgi:hyaluronan synthase
MSLPVYYYVLGTPLGVLGLVRWACWLVRRIPAVLYRPITGEHRLPMSVVVPVYQEDPEVFAAAIESWLANDVEEVILVIDVSDEVCRGVAARYPVRVLVTDVPGKRDALRRGWNAARTELVALVDSDTVWAADVAVEVCKPFADPQIGGVGTRQNVYGSKGFLARITDMFLDHRYFDENASQSLLGRAVSCLSGRTAVYRRKLLMEIEHDFMNETFWGVPCLSGDDKRLTTLILERGHLTYMQRTAEVWSTFPNTWKIFFKQRLRWARNTWRSDLRALSRRWVWRKPFLAYTMIDKGVSSFTLLLGPTFMIYSMIVGNWVFCAVLAAWWQVSRSAKLLPHLRRRPSSFFYIPGYVAVSWLMALIKLQALLTIRKQRWLTRQVAVQDGAVVRTGPPDEPVLQPLGSTPEPVPAPEAVPVSVGGPEAVSEAVSQAVSEAPTARIPVVGPLPRPVPAPRPGQHPQGQPVPAPPPGPRIEGHPVPTPRPRLRTGPEPVRGEPVEVPRPRSVDRVSGPSRAATAPGHPPVPQRRPRHAVPSPTPYPRRRPDPDATAPTGELSVVPVPIQRAGPGVPPRHALPETGPVRTEVPRPRPGGARRDGVTGSAVVRAVHRYDDPPTGGTGRRHDDRQTAGPGRVRAHRPDPADLDPRHPQEGRSGSTDGAPPMPADPDDPRWEVSA